MKVFGSGKMSSLAKRQLKSALKKTAKRGKKKVNDKASDKKKSLMKAKMERQKVKEKERIKLINKGHKFNVKYEKNTGSAKELVNTHKLKKGYYDISKTKMVKALNKIGYTVKVTKTSITVLNVRTKRKLENY